MGRVLTVCFACSVLMVTQTKGLTKSILSLSSVLIAAGVYFTQTRGPWIGFGLVLLIFLFTKTTMRKFAFIVVLIISVTATIGTAKKFSLTKGTLFSERQNTVVDREISYLTTVKMIVDHPILGIGFGKFNKEWSNYFRGNKNIDFGGFDGSHNTFLTMICELGSIGFVIYFIMFYKLVSFCYTTYKKLDITKSFEKSICIIAIALAGMYVVTGTVSDLRWSLMANNLVYIFFGLVASISNNQKSIEFRSEIIE
jgi:O-antigen ligase